MIQELSLYFGICQEKQLQLRRLFDPLLNKKNSYSPRIVLTIQLIARKIITDYTGKAFPAAVTLVFLIFIQTKNAL